MVLTLIRQGLGLRPREKRALCGEMHCQSTALSRVNAARRRLKRGIKRPHTAGPHICRSRASTVHLQAWFKGCSPAGGLLDKGWCQSLHNFIVHCRRHPHKPRKGSWIFVTQLDFFFFFSQGYVVPVSVGYVGMEHEEEDITAFRIHVHPLTSRLQVPRSSENYGLYMPQIRSDTEVIQKWLSSD